MRDSNIEIDRIDHFVLTVRDLDIALSFYSRILGMKAVQFGEGRNALSFGNQKINLHVAGNEFEPKSKLAMPGSADFCLISITSLDVIIAHLNSQKVRIIEGPVAKTGATGPIRSIYFRDPDGNLVEVSNCVS